MLAAELAQGWGAPLLAVHTWRDVAEDPGRGVYRLPETWDTMAADAAALLTYQLRAVRGRYPDLHIVQRVVGDTPLSALLDLAPDARLIVVGSRGVRSKPGMLMGSTSRGLVEFASCPVLVVRPPLSASVTVDTGPRAGPHEA
jgi:nucleotide-binding universal stress UspA family protein